MIAPTIAVTQKVIVRGPLSLFEVDARAMPRRVKGSPVFAPAESIDSEIASSARNQDKT